MTYDLKDFNKEVIEPSEHTPVVIDFWAEWCGPCRMLSPVLEKLANGAGKKWKLVKINTEEFPQIAAQFRVRSIPAVKMVYQKKIVSEFTGALPEHQIRKWLKENLPVSDDQKDVQETVEEYLSEGNREKARDLLSEMVNGDLDDKDSLAQLAMLFLPEEMEKAERYIHPLMSEPKYEIEQQTYETVQHLHKVANGESEIENQNQDVADSYKEGAELLIQNDYDGALEKFLDCLIKDRSIDDDGPRKACIAIFTLLGNMHPTTQKYRRRFSMALY